MRGRVGVNAKNLHPLLTAIVIALAGAAHSQTQRPGVGATSPNFQNQNLETMEQIRLLDEQRRLEEQRRHDALTAKFMKAIKPRRHLFADFDHVVIHGKTPVTPGMLALMAESPYAADIAYYLGKHPEESGAIAQMQPAEASLAVRQLEATITDENAGRQ
jgi:hypothetical protein